MRSDDRAARNRANAQKSTGPRTAQGKAIVSANARRHGVTSRPDPTSVAAWARIILDQPDLGPPDVLTEDRRIAVALALADAEVRLGAARAALDAFERGVAPPSKTVQGLQSRAEIILDAFRDEGETAKGRQLSPSILRRLKKGVIDDTVQGGQRHLLLRRYLREACAHRNRAFQTWLACLKRPGSLEKDSVHPPNLPKQSQKSSLG